MTVAAGTLDIDGLTFRVGGRALVEDVSLAAAPGEMVGLLGPNGAGKSTLLRSVYRVNRPAAGTVRVNGEDVWQRTAAWVARNVGTVLQEQPSEFPLTVRDVVAMGRSPHKRLFEADNAHDRDLVAAAIELVELADFAGRPFRTLSGGERQRVLVARCLAQQPALLVLDEPTNHLDIHHQLHLLRFLRRLGITILAALHDLNLAAMFCDRLCLLDCGRVAAIGTPAEVLTRERLSLVYRIEASIHRHPETGRPWVMTS
ncbi:MAG: ABC transporter ATP-binding protein [Bauldia sp.]